MNRNLCLICGEGNNKNYFYNNHEKKLILFIKASIGTILFYVSKALRVQKHHRFIFTKLMRVSYCQSCQHATLLSKINNIDLNSYYSYRFWGTVGIELPSHDIRARGQFKYAEKLLIKNKIRILEIGAGSASMLSLIKNKNSSAVLDAIEPGEQWDEHYQKNGINRVSSFFPWNSKLSYDYIHTSHWLEHVLDLELVIASIKKILKKDGHIYIEVPNTNSEYWNLDIKDVPHINFFSIKSLKTLMISHGFSPVQIGEYGYTNLEFYESVIEKKELSKFVIRDAEKSISRSLERKNGNIIRSLFKLI